jgi:hypothetical protein
VQQTIEGREVEEALFLEDAGEIELHVRLAAHQGGVAQQAQRQAVGDQSPDVLGAIQVFLHQRVWRQAWPAARCHATEFLPHTDDVDRWCIVGFARAMRDGECQAVGLVRALVVAWLVAEQPKERDHPSVARDRGASVIFSEAFTAVLKHSPQRPGISEGCRDLVGQVPSSLQAEIGGALSRKVAGKQLIEEVGPEKATFNANRRK